MLGCADAADDDDNDDDDDDDDDDARWGLVQPTYTLKRLLRRPRREIT